MELKGQKLTKIGVFYDGNYFLHVSNYYNWFHEKRNRISISGLHNFIKEHIASLEKNEPNLCRIVDAHYFRSRLSASEALQRGNQLYYDRVFDDILMAEGVITHYLPVKPNNAGFKSDKSLEVWLSLEAYELALSKKFDVFVFITSDGDFSPLIKKLNSLGTRVMLISWDFEYTNDEGQRIVTRTSQDLLSEVSYPVAMHEFIDNTYNDDSPLIEGLFVQSNKDKTAKKTINFEDYNNTEVQTGEIFSLKNGYGFIKFPPNNLFFHYQSLIDTDFSELTVGDKVQFSVQQNEKGEPIAINVKAAHEYHNDLYS